MPTLPERILSDCKQVLRDHYGENLVEVVLYGSTARGTDEPASDIDLLILLESPFDYFEELAALAELLYPIQLDSSRLICAKPAAVNEYNAGKIQLYRNVRKDGVAV